MKDKIAKFFTKRINVNWIVSVIIILIYTLGLTAVMLIAQPNGLGDLKIVLVETKGLMFLLNFLPILLVNLALFFIMNNLVLSSSIVGTIVIIASIVNRNKIFLRQDPFLPWDIFLFREAFNISQSMSIKAFSLFILLVFLIIAFTIICYIFIKNKEMSIYLRVLPSIIFIAIILFINNKYYKDVALFNKLHVVGNIYNQVDNFNSKGFVYSFIYTKNTNKMEKFDGYDKNIVANYSHDIDETLLKKSREKEYPNVFMIMGEAYSDISENPLIDFDGFVDPMQNYKDMLDDSIYGRIIVPGLGGGTGDTEFDVLTGANSRFFRKVPFSYRMVNQEMNSIASVLSMVDYENIALSPSHSWFYNRENVFKHFGFSDYIHLGYFEEEMFKGQYVSEENTFNEIINQFETHRENSDKPFFNFTVTIQNHGPYKDKYQFYDVEQNFNTTADFKDDDINALSNYFEGAIDADRELKRIKDYCEASDEPMVLVYFGDHIPGFSQEIYEILLDDDSSDLTEYTNRFNIPYIIWQNKASKDIRDFDKIMKDIPIPEHERISSFYLYPIFLKLMGLDAFDDYTELSLQLLKQYPIMLEQRVFDGKGNNFFYEDIEVGDISKFKQWQYYKIFDYEK